MANSAVKSLDGIKSAVSLDVQRNIPSKASTSVCGVKISDFFKEKILLY